MFVVLFVVSVLVAAIMTFLTVSEISSLLSVGGVKAVVQKGKNILLFDIFAFSLIMGVLF